jgi:carbamate kinase
VDRIEAAGNGCGAWKRTTSGLFLQKAELAEKEVNLAMASLDVCGAQSQGQIGYMLAQNLQNELKRRKIEKSVACVLEQTIVDKDDRHSKKPTKPIGGFMGK